VQENGTTRNPQSSLTSPMRFPGEDGGRSLAEMAQRDLDAALQLLADRAQYITGASGAAIALRRSGMADMLCRASTGSNAPELGALLSTEFGLSGESVRTRKALRCDDAERDARVNQDVCRQLGIASVVVMPVVNDDEVLGVFELFSGQAHAFGDRDLSAVQRLSEMVETAVRLARATATLPGQLQAMQISASEPTAPAVAEQIVDVELPAIEVPNPPGTVEGFRSAGCAVGCCATSNAATELPAASSAAAGRCCAGPACLGNCSCQETDVLVGCERRSGGRRGRSGPKPCAARPARTAQVRGMRLSGFSRTHPVRGMRRKEVAGTAETASKALTARDPRIPLYPVKPC
jgi:hypothetical protein